MLRGLPGVNTKSVLMLSRPWASFSSLGLALLLLPLPVLGSLLLQSVHYDVRYTVSVAY